MRGKAIDGSRAVKSGLKCLTRQDSHVYVGVGGVGKSTRVHEDACSSFSTHLKDEGQKVLKDLDISFFGSEP